MVPYTVSLPNRIVSYLQADISGISGEAKNSPYSVLSAVMGAEIRSGLITDLLSVNDCECQ